MHSLKKFKIAEQRLNSELDIQRHIALNRITKLIQKLLFTARQRRTVPYSRKYVLTENDIDPGKADARPELEDAVAHELATQDEHLKERLWRDIDPENDTWDRRLLYEVTGSTEFGLGDFTDSTDEERNSLLLRKSVNSKQKPQDGQGTSRKS